MLLGIAVQLHYERFVIWGEEVIASGKLIYASGVGTSHLTSGSLHCTGTVVLSRDKHSSIF